MSTQPASNAELLQLAICQAVGLLNGEIIETPNLRQAHNILRQALVDYADLVAVPDDDERIKEIKERRKRIPHGDWRSGDDVDYLLSLLPGRTK